MTDAERIEAIERRLRSATPGPWRPRIRSTRAKALVQTIDGRFIADCGSANFNGSSEDALFIAHAPSDIEFLLGLAKRGK